MRSFWKTVSGALFVLILNISEQRSRRVYDLRAAFRAPLIGAPLTKGLLIWEVNYCNYGIQFNQNFVWFGTQLISIFFLSWKGVNDPLCDRRKRGAYLLFCSTCFCMWCRTRSQKVGEKFLYWPIIGLKRIIDLFGPLSLEENSHIFIFFHSLEISCTEKCNFNFPVCGINWFN